MGLSLQVVPCLRGPSRELHAVCMGGRDRGAGGSERVRGKHTGAFRAAILSLPNATALYHSSPCGGDPQP